MLPRKFKYHSIQKIEVRFFSINFLFYFIVQPKSDDEKIDSRKKIEIAKDSIQNLFID